MRNTLMKSMYEPDPFWHRPLTIAKTGFKNKALSAFHVNLAIGCSHGCRYCFVPSVSTGKQSKKLSEYGVSFPAMQWGAYLLPRIWDEPSFRKSLITAVRIPEAELLPDGHRAAMYCSTTDPFQVSRHPDKSVRAIHQTQLDLLFRRSLEIIRDESDLRVRILTRSPLAERYFDLMKSLGDRLLFGMSLPSLDDSLVKRYEPYAPSVKQRLKCLQRAVESRLHVYVAVAPTFPEQDIEDYRKLITVIKLLDPVTIFHEPINLRGKNVDLMENQFLEDGHEFRADVFRNSKGWAVYAARALKDFELVAGELGLSDRLKLWPDQALLGDDCMNAVVQAEVFEDHLKMTKWVNQQWENPSAWPTGALITNIERIS